jgi:hypothetical protein
MVIYNKTEIDPNLDYQLLDCGAGLLEIYTLGKRTASFSIGEIAIRNIKSRIEYLSEDRALELVKSYCDTAARVRSTIIQQLS